MAATTDPSCNNGVLLVLEGQNRCLKSYVIQGVNVGVHFKYMVQKINWNEYHVQVIPTLSLEKSVFLCVLKLLELFKHNFQSISNP